MSTPGRPGPRQHLALLADGYESISKRCERYGSDVFETRLLFEPTVCMRGAEAAEVFYDTTRFTRAAAAPARLLKTLFGRGGVQGLDGDAHRVRKAMFLSLMSADEIDRFVALTDAEWRRAAARWQTRDCVVLFDEMMDVLTRSVCAWAGVPLPGPHVATRTADLAAMIDAPGAVNHRCAGEWMTIALMRHAVGFLTGTIDYEVPVQDLTLRPSRMPAIPRSRFVMTQVRLRG